MKYRAKRRNPQEYMCINGDMHIVDKGQFVLVDDYNNLLQRYKKLLKLARVKGII